jgi:hypothetical protein
MHLHWLRYFLKGDSSAIPTYTNSQCVVSFIRIPVLEDMQKHIDVIVNHVREREEARYIRFGWISGTENVADISVDVFTKALLRTAFEKHRDSRSLSIADH